MSEAAAAPEEPSAARNEAAARTADAEAPPEAPIFAQPAFMRVWLAHTASQLGDRVHALALSWWTLATTGSLAWTGAMLIATTLPAVLLGPVAGTIADRWERKPLLVGLDVARALLAAGVAGLAFSGQLGVPTAIALSAALATLTAFFAPAAITLVPALVPPAQVLSATSLMEASVQGAAIAGPAIGGLVVGAAGVAGAFGLNGLSFVASALLLLGLALPTREAGPHAEPFWQAMGGGFRVLRADPTVAGVLVAFAGVNVFSVPVLLYMPHFAKDVFRVGATGLGWMEAALGLGMLAAALFWAARRGDVRPYPVVAGGLAGVAACVAAMGAWPSYALHLAALAGAGASMGSLNVVIVAWFQGRVPAAEAGRFFALLSSTAMATIPLSYGLYGWLADVLDPARLLLLNSVAIAAMAVAVGLVPGFRRA